MNKIEKQVGRLTGVEDVKVHFASARIEIGHDGSQVSVDDLVAEGNKSQLQSYPVGVLKTLLIRRGVGAMNWLHDGGTGTGRSQRFQNYPLWPRSHGTIADLH